MEHRRINIAVAGGPCTGKSTLAALLFSRLKDMDCDYDLVTEEARKLKAEFGDCRSTFERLYLWQQQEREELRSRARDGFITDSPLFQQYAWARVYSSEPRDFMAVREIFRMCQRLEDRYQLIVIAEQYDEIVYRNDPSRSSDAEAARWKHHFVRVICELFWPERILFVRGSTNERLRTVLERIEQMRIHQPNANS